jgi:hypothetical protein
MTTSARIVELLAPTLGWEKGAEMVASAQSRLGMSGSTLTYGQAGILLDELGRTPGMVGISARFARSRLEAPRAAASATGPASAPARQPPSGKPGEASVTADDIADLLTSALGAEKAQEIVRAAVRRFGFTPERLDRTQAMALLDQLAVEPGVVGLCARFGKARLILRFAA